MTSHGQTAHSVYPEPEDLDDDRIFRFRFRCSIATHAWYSNRQFRYSLMIRRALLRFLRAVRGGMIDISCMSRFLSRDDIADKVETSARVTFWQKDILEKLAFALNSSQAEVLRMALEWYMEAVSPIAKPEQAFAARRKWHHDTPSITPKNLRFPFWEPERQLEWQIPPPEIIKTAIRELQSRL